MSPLPPPTQSETLDSRKIALEERKLETETELRRKELDLKVRESTWLNRLASPLTTTIIAGMLTLAASVAGTLFQGRQTLQLEREKFRFNKDQETQKQEHELILKIISVGDVKQARSNLEFLAETGLIADKSRAERILQSKSAPVLPAPPAPAPAAAAITGANQTVQCSFPARYQPEQIRDAAAKAFATDWFGLTISLPIGNTGMLLSSTPRPSRILPHFWKSAQARIMVGAVRDGQRVLFVDIVPLVSLQRPSDLSSFRGMSVSERAIYVSAVIQHLFDELKATVGPDVTCALS